MILIMLLFLTGCGEMTEMVENGREEELTEVYETVPVEIEEVTSERITEEIIKQQVAEMSLEEKAGQVLFLSLRHNQGGQPLWQLEDDDKKIFQEIKPGGMILFKENIHDNQQVKNLIAQMQAESSIPLFMAVDQEGGRVSRLTVESMDFPKTPTARELGKSEDIDKTLEIGKLLGKELKTLGFNMNMAPVVDVDSNPRNPVIGERSFGSDPELVANMGMAMARGMQLEGVIPVLKHFPGHGDTELDSHLESVVLNHSIERLEVREFLPFRRGISLNMPVIMTGHIEIRVLDEGVPATLSSVLLTDLLRREWGYQGVVISDALEMGAIRQRWTSGEAAVKALAAGVDLLLMPENPWEAHEAIMEAVSGGILPEDQLDQAVTRILALKMKTEMMTP